MSIHAWVPLRLPPALHNPQAVHEDRTLSLSNARMQQRVLLRDCKLKVGLCSVQTMLKPLNGNTGNNNDSSNNDHHHSNRAVLLLTNHNEPSSSNLSTRQQPYCHRQCLTSLQKCWVSSLVRRFRRHCICICIYIYIHTQSLRTLDVNFRMWNLALAGSGGRDLSCRRFCVKPRTIPNPKPV